MTMKNEALKDVDTLIVQKCQECQQSPFLYQCPRCSFRSCSLTCCRAHKSRTGCNGKRDRTAFLTVSRMNDNVMNSDFHFLEDVLNTVEAGKRLLEQSGAAPCGQGHGQPHAHNKRLRTSAIDEANHAVEEHPILRAAATTPAFASSMPIRAEKNTMGFSGHAVQHVHPKWRSFQRQAQRRGTSIMFMPHGMQRHKDNKSYCKKEVLHWFIEWCIHGDVVQHQENTCTDSSEVKTLRTAPQRISLVAAETTTLDAILKVLPLPQRESLDGYVILLKRIPSPSNQPKYVQLDKASTLSAALQDMTVIEYPILELVPTGRLDEFSLVIQAMQKKGNT
jgi:hypothetical protein